MSYRCAFDLTLDTMTMTKFYAIDGTGRFLIEAGDSDRPDVLSIREQPDPLFGPRLRGKKPRCMDRRRWQKAGGDK